MNVNYRTFLLAGHEFENIIKSRYYSVTPEFSTRLKIFVIFYACLLVLLEMHE